MYVPLVIICNFGLELNLSKQRNDYSGNNNTLNQAAKGQRMFSLGCSQMCSVYLTFCERTRVSPIIHTFH